MDDMEVVLNASRKTLYIRFLQCDDMPRSSEGYIFGQSHLLSIRGRCGVVQRCSLVASLAVESVWCGSGTPRGDQ